jgi:hypothetical protein
VFAEWLPARLSRLTRVTTIVIATSASASLPSTATTAAKTLSAAARTLSLGLSLVDLQCAAAEFGSVKRGYRLFGFAGICHFNECKAT